MCWSSIVMRLLRHAPPALLRAADFLHKLGEGPNVLDRMCCCNLLLKANGMPTAMLRRVAWVPAFYCHRVARSDDSYLVSASRATHRRLLLLRR